MERRKFLKYASWSSLGFSFLSASSTYADSGIPLERSSSVFSPKGAQIDPLVPVKFYHNRRESMYRQLLELKEKYGLRRFLICEPLDEVKLTGFPKPDTYRKIGELILEIKHKLAPHNIEIGWWCAPSIRSGYDARFQYITDLSGKVSKYAPCPLDPTYREEFSNNIATVARIAKPGIIQFEDDFELSWQPPHVTFGCFCPRHIAEFSKREETEYTRESLLDLFKTNSKEAIKVRKKWAELSRDTLVEFASLIRTKIDIVEPTTRVSLCQSSLADFDGDFTEAVARAFAGSTKPLVRLYGSSYSSDKTSSLPADIFHALYSKQHIGSDIECMHESDSYPHTRFFMSAGKLKSLMTAAFAYGFDNSLLYATQYLDNMLEEKGYLEMFRSERHKFSGLQKAVKETYVVGPRIYHDPFSHTLVPFDPAVSGWSGIPLDAQNSWVDVLGRFGIPYTAKESSVTAISGVAVRLLSDVDIKKLLGKGVLLDGTAAHELSIRGFGYLIGAEVTKGSIANFCYEGLRKPDKHKNIKGELMYNFIFSPAGGEGGNFYVLDPKQGAEVITDFLDPNEKPVIPGLIWFENELGGRIAISAFDLFKNNSSAVFNYKKKELIKETIEWLGKKDIPVFVKDHPNVFCICNLALSGQFTVITLINLSSDTVSSFTLDVASEWIGASVEILQLNGTWQKQRSKISGRSVAIMSPLALMDPVVVRISK